MRFPANLGFHFLYLTLYSFCFVGKFDPGPHDESLTNIQWFCWMRGKNLVQKQREEALLANIKDIRIVASEHQIEKVSVVKLKIWKYYPVQTSNI